MRILLSLIFTIIVLSPVFVQAANISSDLQAQMQVSQPDNAIQVWIELPKVVSGKQMAANASAMPTRAERHKAAMIAFKENHAQAQKALLEYLYALPNAQDKNIKAHWLINLVEADLTAQEITDLSNRTDIEKMYTVPQLEMIEPVINQKSSQKLSAGIESNLTYINAPIAWGMGYTGAGRLVCSFDGGVDGEHPALKQSWKGLDGDSLAAWFDPAKGQMAPHYIPDCNIPGCNPNHGTHTMGTMVGIDTLTGDTVGVAPEAKWISAAVIDILGASIVDGFEWAADPDRNQNTIDDVPDVINHSWGIPRIGCENLFYDLIDNIEALGIVNIFAAGNEGSAASTIRNPANRANDSLDCFAVGNLDEITNNVANGSSRGPSICPNGAIKPNVSAPGQSIRSTMPNGTYSLMSGTSMAAPHVSGLVALLRQKNPNATVNEIKLAILNSSDNIGQVVPNNNIGWGKIDCVVALNALSNVNTVPNLSLYMFDHPPISAGDTVIGSIVIQNSGASLNSVAASIIGSNSALQVLSGVASFGTIVEGDTVRAGSSFQVIVADTASVGSFLPIDLELTGTGFTDTVKLYFIVEPKTSRSFVTHNVGNIEFSLSNFGTYGFAAGQFFPMLGASGFKYNGGGNDLFEGGLLIGQNTLNVADGVRNTGGEPDGDFQIMPGGDIRFVAPKIGVTQQSFSRFSDSRAETPMGLEIEQSSYAFSNAPYTDFIILQYIITNRSGAALNNLYIGLYMDWDIINYASNSGGYETVGGFSWVAYRSGVSATSDYRGMKVLEPLTDGSLTQLADSIAYGNAPLDGFTELEKINALSNGFTGSETYKSSQQDLNQIISAKISLADNQTDTVAFALLAGDSFGAVQTAATEASNAYSGVVTDIIEIEGPDQLPQSFSLHQNYPNPFNPSTSILFELPRRTEYKIEIFNLVGQKLYEIKETAAAGRHSFEWDATGFASGMYLYKFTADNYSESKKMLLLK